MGCSSDRTIDSKQEPKILDIPNERQKDKSFPSGEIYFIRTMDSTTTFRKSVLGGLAILELYLALKTTNMDIISELRGLIVSVAQSDLSNHNIYTTLGSTEELSQDDNLVYSTNFRIIFYFQRHQIIRFEIINKNVNNAVPIDTVYASLGQIMGSMKQSIELPFNFNDQGCTSLIVSGISCKDEERDSLMTIDIITDLVSMPYSDYFVVLSTSHLENQYKKLWKSEELTGKKLQFSTSKLSLHELCLGDRNKLISLEFYGIYVGKIGSLETSLNKITEAKRAMQALNIISENNEIIGSCRIHYTIDEVTKFIHLIEHGLQVSLFVGIDYTSSNENPNTPKSLHYIDGTEPNQYEQAIRNCGSIIAYYDFDKLFPVFGFGGIIQGTQKTSHCFPVNFEQDPNVSGVDGIIEVYRNSLNRIQLDGPTYFAPLLKMIVKTIKENELKKTSSVYYILLLITDGILHDYEETKEVICEAAHLPFSIVIIGVGNENFDEMVKLDGDKTPLVDKNGVKIERDIVQFVCYNDYKIDPSQLSEQVLSEIPFQLEQYYRRYKNFKGLNMS